MVNKCKADRVSAQMSAYIKYLHQHGNESINTIWRRYGLQNNISRATIYRHASGDITVLTGVKKKRNVGRPKLLSDRSIRMLMRTFKMLRTRNINFTSVKVQLAANLHNVCSNRTVRRALNARGMFYLQPRKKGLLTAQDLKKRVKFARNIKSSDNSLQFWTEKIAFFFDGTGFIHKTHPQDQATAPRGRIWRKKGEGLAPGCTAKGSKAGYNGRVAHFFVAISYRKGVVSCIQYCDTLTGAMFSTFVKEKFKKIFQDSFNPHSRVFLQDGDPRQNSAIARKSMEECGYHCHHIPARSPDLNPIENVFHLVDRKLRQDAIEQEITNETFEQFSARVQECMMTYPTDIIDRVIESLPKRIDLIITKKGARLKY